MAFIEFFRGIENDSQEKILHPDYNIEIFSDDDKCWQLIKRLDSSNGLSPEDMEKLHKYRPEGESVEQFLGFAAEQLLVNPQIRMKDSLHVSGNEPTPLSVVGMITHWQDRLASGMIENPEKLMEESFLARSVMDKVLTRTAEYKKRNPQEIISLMSVSDPYELRLPSEVSNNIPQGLNSYDIYNSLLNTGRGLRLAVIAQDLGYPLTPYQDLVAQANQEYNDFFVSSS